MDVTCERCSTAYEFDDALVSERGTTVKCTNCGHQFKVRRPQPAGAPERWLVRTIDGRELEFRALRELQAAIASAVITRDDVLSRGGSRPRRLGNIAELEPFFASVAGSSASQSTSLGLGPRAPAIAAGPPPAPPPPAGSRGRMPTPASLGSIAQAVPAPSPSRTDVSVAIPLPRSQTVDETTVVIPGASRSAPGAAPPPPPRRSNPPPPPAAAKSAPARPAPPGIVVPPAGAPPVPAPSVHDEVTAHAMYDEDTRSARPGALAREDLQAPTAPFEIGKVLDPVHVRAAQQEDWSPAAPPPAPSAPRAAPARPLPPPTPPPVIARAPEPAPPPRESAPEPSEDPPQNQETASIPPLTPTPAAVRNSYSDDMLAEPRFSGAVSQRRSGAARWIVGVVVAGVAVFAAVTVGGKLLAPSTAPGGQSDARITSLLTDGEKSFADGDLESAKEQFDKASALAERDPRAVADLARLAAAKGDVDWLRVRLLADNDPEQAVARRELEQAAQRARKAADHAAAVAPSDPAVVRSRVDALRLAGDLDGARKLVSGIAAASAQPDNALTLAALDLAESKPDWTTVVGRLRAALPGDANLGRARSMLVFALARSGDLSAAKAELDRLGALPRPHPLLGALRAYVARAEKTVDPNALPDASGKPAAGKAPPAATGGAPQASREPKEKPSSGGSFEPKPSPSPSPPDEHVVPGGPIDTSDLPGVKAPTPPPPSTGAAPAPQPTAAPAPTSTVPPGVDTSDLPGFK
jgi:predicted Zn finger-like uncharacterized protein